MSPGEKTRIAQTISQLGVLDTVSGAYSLKVADADLRLSADGTIAGFVSTPGGEVAVSDILNSDFGAMSRENAAAAVANLRNALAAAAKYKGFARHLSGTEQTVKLENNLLKLDISTKGGAISAAVLKDYNRYDSTAVDLMAGLTDSYSFTLTTASQRFNTSEFYFTPVEATDSSVTMQLNLGDGAVWGIRYTLPADSYVVGMEVMQSNMQTVIPGSVADMEFTWHQKMAQRGRTNV